LTNSPRNSLASPRTVGEAMHTIRN
jgi:hypothetical protein